MESRPLTNTHARTKSSSTHSGRKKKAPIRKNTTKSPKVSPDNCCALDHKASLHLAGVASHQRRCHSASSFNFLLGNAGSSRAESRCPSGSSFSNFSMEWGAGDDNQRSELTDGTRVSCTSPATQLCPPFFQSLPADCKLKVFTYLTNKEKGLAAQVCEEWAALLITPGLWSSVDLTDFPLTCVRSAEHDFTDICYDCYRDRVHKFMRHLLIIKPTVRQLVFKYDIADIEDGWLTLLQDSVLNLLNCKELRYVHLNWKETPTRPFWLETVRWCRCNEVVQRHRHRQRLFVRMFDKFTSLALNVETLILPFDWSEKSVTCIGRLKKLHSLVLEKYSVFQHLDQKLLTHLLTRLPSLRRLMLEVWTPSGHGLITYVMTSESIEYLDISQSRGFYLQSLDMPRLSQFIFARHPWNGPLVSSEQIQLPCLYDVLVHGTPNLKKLNDHILDKEWRHRRSPELDEALKLVCSCRKHKTGWAM